MTLLNDYASCGGVVDSGLIFRVESHIERIERRLAASETYRNDLLDRLTTAENDIDALRQYQNGMVDAGDLQQCEQRLAAAEEHLLVFSEAVTHVTEGGNTKRSFSADGWAMVHSERLTDLVIAEERLAEAEAKIDHVGDTNEMIDKWATSLTVSDVQNLRDIISELRDMPANDRESFRLQAIAKRIEEML
jgi:exonuclease VII small subunit